MNRIQTLLVAFLTASGLTLAQAQTEISVPDEIQNAGVTQVHKLPARGSQWAKCSSESTCVQSLNGDWKFHWSRRPEERPIQFFEPTFDASQWATIPVPSTWEREGYGTPLYVNSRYPFQVDPPRVMGEPDKSFTSFDQRNPVGSYLHPFDIPETWTGQRIVLYFGGVRSAMFRVDQWKKSRILTGFASSRGI